MPPEVEEEMARAAFAHAAELISAAVCAPEESPRHFFLQSFNARGMAALSRGVGELSALARRTDSSIARRREQRERKGGSKGHRQLQHQRAQQGMKTTTTTRRRQRPRGPCEEPMAELQQLMLALDAVARGKLSADDASKTSGTRSDVSSLSSAHRGRHHGRRQTLLDEHQRRLKGYPDLRPFSFIAVLDKAVDDSLDAEVLWESIDLGNVDGNSLGLSRPAPRQGEDGEGLRRCLRASGVLTRAAAQQVSSRLKKELGLE